MAIYHLEAKIVTRGEGRSACAASAYMSCSQIYNDYDGIQHDYTKKRGLVWQNVFLPTMAPAEWKDREILWNAVEAEEKAKDSRLAREFVVSLPVELDKDKWIALLTEFIQTNFVDAGMCADVAVHDTDGHNPHAHILLTVRPLAENGKWQNKTEKEYICVRNGEERAFTAKEYKVAQTDGWEKQYPYKVGKKKVYMAPSVAETQGLERASKNPKSTRYGRQNPISEKWNSEEQLILWRAAWGDAVNCALEQSHCPERVDHRSHAARGIDEQPTITEGVAARAMERKGLISDRCELNRQIKADNARLRELKALVAKLTAAMQTTVSAIAHAMEAIRRNMIVLNYGLLHIRKRRHDASEYLDRARPAYQEYAGLRRQRADKETERRALSSELRALPALNISRRRELKGKIAALSEDIEELRNNEMNIVHGFGKEDARGMKGIPSYLSIVEANIQKMDEQETQYVGDIEKARHDFDELRVQASDLDQDELTDARLALRPQMEHDAHECISKSLSRGKASFRYFEKSKKTTDDLLKNDHSDIRQREQKVTAAQSKRKSRLFNQER